MVYLIRTDVENNDEKIKMEPGSNILGRGSVGCDDHRVSRSHCEIVVNKEEIKIKSLHSNPCFIRTSNVSDTIIITSGEERVLQNGDKIGLLPVNFWYQIISTEADVKPEPSIGGNTSKHHIYDDSSDDNTKQAEINDADIKPEPSVSGKTPEKRTYDDNTINTEINDTEVLGGTTIKVKTEVDTSEATSVNDELPAKRQRFDDSTDDVKPDVNALRAAIVDSGNGIASSSDVKQESKDSDGTQDADIGSTTPATSNGPAVRERCMYGSRCYRKNLDHKRILSHPGDPDYGQSANLACPLGSSCQRRDPRHWRDQTHPPGTKPRRRKRGPKKAASRDDLKPGDRKARKVIKKRPSWSGSGSENEYDSEDSWLTDGSDDWNPTGDSSSSEEDI